MAATRAAQRENEDTVNIMGVINKLLGAGQNKLVKKYRKRVEKINGIEPHVQKMDDEAIRYEYNKIRKAIADGGDPDSFLEYAMALIREEIYRASGQRAYDVQMIAALALNDGHIAEAATGEGKSLVSRVATAFNVLSGKQVHVVTVNEYLAKRDADACAECIGNLGISIGYIYNQQPPASKKKAYACDVVYGVPAEFGFDYLRDNMVQKIDDKVQKKHDYAIIDEIDSILIDEARTPLIISGAGKKTNEIYKKFAAAVGRLNYSDVDMEEKNKQIAPTEEGLTKVEQYLGVEIYADETGALPNHLMQALKAKFLFHRDKDYVVDGGEVKIVDPNTGRIMEGRRWSDGLHQAIEAKERVTIQDENQTLASVTLQNFFRLYDKLSGLTGTAMTEDAEFRKTYNMGVVAIPTHKPIQRIDAHDLVYRTTEAKYKAIADEVQRRHDLGQPLLIGTVSVENSEKLSRMLDKRGIRHNTLNAKNHEQEAHIIAQAGRTGAVTIATNMAGRGTDIILGGNADEMYDNYVAAQIAKRQPDPVTGVVDDYIPQEELDEAKRQITELCKADQERVLEAGGLCVIGTERHESRRIDNQLRGRAGRQGDPGYSQFYISLEDDLMRLFGQERMASIQNMLAKADFPDDQPLDMPIVSKAIEKAQQQVESMNYESRKNVLQYDDVVNKQRLAIYAERDKILDGTSDISEKIAEIEHSVAVGITEMLCAEKLPDDWDYDAIRAAFIQSSGGADASFITDNIDDMYDMQDLIEEHLVEAYNERRELIGDDIMDQVTRIVMLNNIDSAWREHLTYIDYLKGGIHLRSYGQRDPLTEYKDEAYQAFEYMVDKMYINSYATIMHIRIEQSPQQQAPQAPAPRSPFEQKSPTGADVLGKHAAGNGMKIGKKRGKHARTESDMMSDATIDDRGAGQDDGLGGSELVDMSE